MSTFQVEATINSRSVDRLKPVPDVLVQPFWRCLVVTKSNAWDALNVRLTLALPFVAEPHQVKGKIIHRLNL